MAISHDSENTGTLFLKDGGVWDAGEGKYTLLRRRSARSPNHDSAPPASRDPTPTPGLLAGAGGLGRGSAWLVGVAGEGNLWRGEESEYYFLSGSASLVVADAVGK